MGASLVPISFPEILLSSLPPIAATQERKKKVAPKAFETALVLFCTGKFSFYVSSFEPTLASPLALLQYNYLGSTPPSKRTLGPFPLPLFPTAPQAQPSIGEHGEPQYFFYRNKIPPSQNKERKNPILS